MSLIKVNDIQTTTGTPNRGKVLQVVQTTKTDTFYSSSGETWYDVTGMSASITPSSSSNKILVQFNLGKISGLNNNAFRITRNGSVMTAGLGDAAGIGNKYILQILIKVEMVIIRVLYLILFLIVHHQHQH